MQLMEQKLNSQSSQTGVPVSVTRTFAYFVVCSLELLFKEHVEFLRKQGRRYFEEESPVAASQLKVGIKSALLLAGSSAVFSWGFARTAAELPPSHLDFHVKEVLGLVSHWMKVGIAFGALSAAHALYQYCLCRLYRQDFLLLALTFAVICGFLVYLGACGFAVHKMV